MDEHLLFLTWDGDPNEYGPTLTFRSLTYNKWLTVGFAIPWCGSNETLARWTKKRYGI